MRDHAGQNIRRVQRRVHNVRVRIKYGRRQLRRISRTATLGGLFLSFLKIGTIGFGGGLAVIANIRAVTVRRRGWLTEQEFAEAFALAQSLPGTSAGNTVTYIGLKMRGWRGAAVAMTGFILPSTLMMIGLAILYRHLRALPDTDRLFHGLNAAVVALIAVTAWRLGQNALSKRWQWWVAVLSFAAVALFHATIIEVVLGAGLVGIYLETFGRKQWQRLRRLGSRAKSRSEKIRARVEQRRRPRRRRVPASEPLPQSILPSAEIKVEAGSEIGAERSGLTAREPTGTVLSEPRKLRSVAVLGLAMPLLMKLGLLVALSVVFLRIGAVTFGGGFVMIPSIEAEAVERQHWLTHQEFADATALGQITPGPVLVTATFIGYRAAGTLGALVTTISIFLPAFLMTIAAGSSLHRFRNNQAVQAFLFGVTPAVVGLLLAAAVSVGRAGIHTFIGLFLAILAVVVLLRFRPNAFWVILGAGALRFLLGLVLW